MKKLILSAIISFLVTGMFAQAPLVFDRMFISSDGSLVLWLKKQGDSIYWQSSKNYHKFNGAVDLGDSIKVAGKWYKEFLDVTETDPVYNAEKSLYIPKSDTVSKVVTPWGANFKDKIKYNDSVFYYMPKDQSAFTGSIFIGTNSGGRYLTHNTGVEGRSNLAIGNASAISLTTGSTNTLIGTRAGANLTTGIGNTAVGALALSSGNVIGTYNLALGTQNLFALTSGSHNLSIGSLGATSLTTGNYNIAIGGYRTLRNLSTGNNNIAIGDSAGFSQSTANKNIYIGHQSGYSNTTDNKLFIENSNSQTPLIGGKFDTDQLGVNKLITDTWRATLNVGGGVDATFYRTATDTMETKAAVRLKQDKLTLTTTGTSGAATLVGNTLNIPQYSGGFTETDPIFNASPAKNITSGNISTWNSLISYPGLSDKLFKYDVANNYYRAFTSQLEPGYTIGAFYGGSELPDPGSYTSINVRSELGIVSVRATDFISARQRMYAGDGFHATDMDTSIRTSAAFRSYGIGTPMLIYFDPLMAVQTNTAYKFDTYRRILPGGYRAQFFNKQSDPVNIEHDGSINLPAGAQFKVNNVAVSGGSEANNLSPLWARGSTLLEGNRTLVSMNNANYDTIKNQTGASMAITLPSAGTWMINLTIQANATDLDCNTWPSGLITGVARSNNTRSIIRETSTNIYVSSPPYVNYTGNVCDTHHSIIYTTTTSNDRIVGVVKCSSSYQDGQIYVDSAYINAIKVSN